jgi:hypothetical protein
MGVQGLKPVTQSPPPKQTHQCPHTLMQFTISPKSDVPSVPLKHDPGVFPFMVRRMSSTTQNFHVLQTPSMNQTLWIVSLNWWRQCFLFSNLQLVQLFLLISLTSAALSI